MIKYKINMHKKLVKWYDYRQLQAHKYHKLNEIQNWMVTTNNRDMIIKVHVRWVYVFVQISYDSQVALMSVAMLVLSFPLALSNIVAVTISCCCVAE